MKRPHFRLFTLLLVILALALSSCFAIRGIRLNVDYLGPGETARVRIELRPTEIDQGTNSWVVLLIGLDDAALSRVSAFDLLGNWGGPLDRVKDDAAEAVMLTEGNCAQAGIDAADMESSFDRWYVYRTRDRVDNSTLTGADMAKGFIVNLLVDRPPRAGDGDSGKVAIFSGNWSDLITNGVPEAGEFVCTGFMSVIIPYVG